jgi:hypothetical protein
MHIREEDARFVDSGLDRDWGEPFTRLKTFVSTEPSCTLTSASPPNLADAQVMLEWSRQWRRACGLLLSQRGRFGDDLERLNRCLSDVHVTAR